MRLDTKFLSVCRYAYNNLPTMRGLNSMMMLVRKEGIHNGPQYTNVGNI